MNIPVAHSPRLRSMMPGLILFGLCLYFSFYLVFGPRGLLSLERLEDDVNVHSAAHDDLKHAREILEANVRLMRPDSLDPDMADEQVRRILGYGKKDEVVIYINNR